jgi:hypothetical protein
LASLDIHLVAPMFAPPAPLPSLEAAGARAARAAGELGAAV